MECKCGKVMSISESPDIQLRVYTDREWDDMLTEDIFDASKAPLPTYDVWRCPHCERIYAFGKPNEEGICPVVKVYKLVE